jgi:hypothetical protein
LLSLEADMSKDIVQQLIDLSMRADDSSPSDASMLAHAADEIERLREATKPPAEHDSTCPYVTGTVTRYCTLTPFTLTDEEREAVRGVADFVGELAGFPVADETKVTLKKTAATLRSMLERIK